VCNPLRVGEGDAPCSRLSDVSISRAGVCYVMELLDSPLMTRFSVWIAARSEHQSLSAQEGTSMVFEAMLRVGALLQAPAIASGSTEMASVYYLSKYISKGSSDDKRKYATWKFHRQVLANFMWTWIQMQHMKHAFTICVMDSGLPCMTFAANRKWLEITESQRHKHDAGLSVEDCQDIAAKLFHAKLQQPKNVMGSTDLVVYVVEFQKRARPHAHVAVFTVQHTGP
jgi:hypothetical protein